VPQSVLETYDIILDFKLYIYWNTERYSFHSHLCTIKINCTAFLTSNADLFKFIPAGIYVGLMIIEISTGYSEKGRWAQNALNGLDELSPLTPANVVIGRLDHYKSWNIRFLDRQLVPHIPKRRPIAWIMHSRKTKRRTLNTVQRTPPTTHNKILFVWVINQVRNKLAEKVKFFYYIL
jgi:hypothetical protein